MRTTAGTLLATYLRAQAAALAAAEADVVAGGPECVHDTRVAARRLRTALTDLPRLLDGDTSADLPGRLRAWSRRLGDVRDLEVQLAALEELGADAARARARDTLGPRLASARDAVVEHLATPEHLRLRADLEHVAAEPPLSAKADRAWEDELPRRLAKAERRVARRARRAASAAGPALDDALHRVRKAARRARYVAEVAAQGDGAAADAAASAAARHEAVHDALGTHHDAVVLRQVLAELRDDAVAAGEDPQPFDALAGAARDRASAALAALALVARAGTPGG
ncbi:CHAD domain-containing protein [Puerhibacterium puerhi]|uniref:CHAD domain-containing protein n=1 Tax=Puerhibacterium puerhi TaxID=2692623 RepID=UPI00135C0450|nr:CHAD domain-containing protein [Puerhibacterium puerhi]